MVGKLDEIRVHLANPTASAANVAAKASIELSLSPVRPPIFRQSILHLHSETVPVLAHGLQVRGKWDWVMTSLL